MASPVQLEAFQPLVQETLRALEADFRISETIAYAAGTLIQRQAAKAQKISLKGVNLTPADV